MPPLRLPLTVEKVFVRAGPATAAFALGDQFRPTRPWDRLPRFGVLLYWPRAVGWLRLAASVGPAGGFAHTVDGLDTVAAAHQCKRTSLAPGAFLETNAFLVASLAASDRVELSVEVDTDSEGFRQAARSRREPGQSGFVETVQVVFFDNTSFEVTQYGQIDLALRPCVPQPVFRGFVAVDLGNTTTTAVALPEAAAVYRTGSIRAVPLETAGELTGDPPPAGTERTPPLESVVRLDEVRSFRAPPPGMRRFPSLPEDDRPDAVRFVAGRLAAAGAAGAELLPGVVFGAKQRLTAKPTVGPDGAVEPVVGLTVPHARPDGTQPEAIDVLARVPGELMFAHAVRRFRQAAGGWPAELALTYPTTYGPGDLRRLKAAAARGWLRALGLSEVSGGEPDEDAGREELASDVRRWLASGEGECLLLPHALDEATAAAFFHLYRRVFEQPGGLDRFRYLHPNGLRLLLIDCGGGTTDAALVAATSPPDDPPRLEVDVLARTGVRTFGGDWITREVCRLVKAKMVAALTRWRTPGTPATPPLPPSAPADPRQARELVEQFIARNAPKTPADDRVLPTRFDARRADPAQAGRRTCANALRDLAEAVKRRLRGGKPVRLKELDPALLGRDTSPLMGAAVHSLPPAEQVKALAAVGEIAVAPWEVDALVRPDARKVVDRCNALVQRVLVSEAGDAEQEVDWVVLSGNGSQYPLVSQLLRDELAVPQAAERMTADADNMKQAVAKGAVMSRMIQRVPQKVRVSFARQLSDLLPYDVAYHTLKGNKKTLLFREYTPYTRLAAEPRRVVLETGADNPTTGNTFFIDRRFPGDDEWSGYASYHFPQGIHGELEVRYDPTTGEFVVRDVATGQVGTFADETSGEHDEPLMRGDI